MTATSTFRLKALLAGVCLAVAATAAHAADVAGIKFDDTTKVAGKDLKLNGAGLRKKLMFKVYAAGLYLTDKTHNVADIMKMDGPRRVTLVMMREISSEDFGQAFMTGLNANSTKEEKTKILNQTMQFGEMFAMFPGLKKGDTLHLDWVPGTGTVVTLNGKKVGDAVPDVAFYNAVLKIWLGEHPADSGLKPNLLGEAG
ncbi:lipoprotein transmembrane [Massilia arenosa]|uniref:Lipoprotein transmembrane n=1 Tax=Zemynaea arenosa TaxID=2561931 RepID=A0A4Y9SNC0_9BURK|nr:chalcone isomerase family protein [Massilia arenosa]TFW28170.1 lipoprotein transmembrane [Massilia arenosa]